MESTFTGTVVELTLCEKTGARIEDNTCPIHGAGNSDLRRRGFAAIPDCAARYIHNSYVAARDYPVGEPAGE